MRTLRWVAAIGFCGAGFALAAAWMVTMFVAMPAKQYHYGDLLIVCAVVLALCQAFWPRRGSMPHRTS